MTIGVHRWSYRLVESPGFFLLNSSMKWPHRPFCISPLGIYNAQMKLTTSRTDVSFQNLSWLCRMEQNSAAFLADTLLV